MASTLQAIPQSDSDDSDFDGFGPSDIESDTSVDSVLSEVDSSGDSEVKVTEFVLSISFIPAHNYIIGSTVEYVIGVSNSIQYCHMSFLGTGWFLVIDLSVIPINRIASFTFKIR